MGKLLLKNATLVCPDRIIQSDLLTDGSRIARIDPDISDAEAQM